jgi:leucyl/phenylalanyl-tRNA--protein transferase
VTERSPYDRGIFPEPRDIVTDELGFVGIGANLEPETLVEAYSKGYFPWEGAPPYPWYSPDPRLIIEPAGFRASRSLRKWYRQTGLTVCFDHDFSTVMKRCASTPRPGQNGTWITDSMVQAYSALHSRHIAHCVSVHDAEGHMVGGLYGLSLGKAFFGESMFSELPNASKLALWSLCHTLEGHGFHFIDCQQDTPHLRSLGAFTITRKEYLDRLDEAVSNQSLTNNWSTWATAPNPIAKTG